MANEKNKKNKKLSLKELQKQNSKLSTRKKEEIIINEEVYDVEIDEKFRKSKQYELLDDLVEFMNEGSKSPALLDLATPYTTLLFIKHFTDIDVSDDIDEAIDLLNVFIDLDVLNQILNVMPEQEVIQVYEILSSTAERMQDNIRETLNEVNKVRDSIDNQEVLDMLKESEKNQNIEVIEEDGE